MSDEQQPRYLSIGNAVVEHLEQEVDSGELNPKELIETAAMLAEMSIPQAADDYAMITGNDMHVPIQEAPLTSQEQRNLLQALSAQRHIIGDHAVASICLKSKVDPPTDTLKGWVAEEWKTAHDSGDPVQIRRLVQRLNETFVESDDALRAVMDGLADQDGGLNAVLDAINRLMNHPAYDDALRHFVEIAMVDTEALVADKSLRQRVEDIIYEKIHDTAWLTPAKFFFSKLRIPVDLPQLQNLALSDKRPANRFVILSFLERLNHYLKAAPLPDWLRWDAVVSKALESKFPAPTEGVLKLLSAHPETLLTPDIMSRLEGHVSSLDALTTAKRWPTNKMGHAAKKDGIDQWMTEVREKFTAMQQEGQMLDLEPSLLGDKNTPHSPSP